MAGPRCRRRAHPPGRADPRGRADVGILLAGRGSAVTGWDAVRARGIGDNGPPSGLVTVLSPTAMGRVVGAVRVRRTERSFTSVVQPLGAPLELTPLTSLPRAVADTALDYRSPGPMRALVGAAVQRRRCSMAELIAEYEAGPRQHSKVLRIALADLRDGARSAAEATAVRRLARSAVPSFEVNVAVVDRNGRLMRVVDVLWRDLRAALEIDSRMFHFSEADWQATLARHNELTRYGLAVTHYPPNRVTAHGSTFVPEVCEWLTCRAAELGRPLSRRRGTRGGGLDPRPFTVPVFA